MVATPLTGVASGEDLWTSVPQDRGWPQVTATRATMPFICAFSVTDCVSIPLCNYFVNAHKSVGEKLSVSLSYS